jgi:beta-glucosidase
MKTASMLEELVSKMTIAEKVLMLSGSDMWRTEPIERLDIPALKMSDGPNGARGDSFTNGKTAACFPAGISLASSWNIELVERVGQALGQEAQTKGASVLLGPTSNIHRSPLNGRNFESFSEDPYLSARMAVAYINGVQSQGVGTSIKHFVCNDSEFERDTISSDVGERALREIYLPAFKAGITEAKSWTIMAAYNQINGKHASENTYLLTDILRHEWGFDGVVVSDWFNCVKSTAPSVNAGLDLEMPGPGIWRGPKLLQAINNGEVSVGTLDEIVLRLLHLIQKAGLFEHPQEREERAVDRPEHRALIREAGSEGIVLLKNEHDLLPLQREKLQSIAVIGPNAKVARIMAGGSAQVTTHYRISPFEGIVNSVGEQVKVAFEQGCTNFKRLPLIDIEQLEAGEDKSDHGFIVTYYNSRDLSGEVAVTEFITSSEMQWFTVPSGVDGEQFSARINARYTPTETDMHTFSLISAGLSRLLINEEEIINNWDQQVRGDAYFGLGSSEVINTVTLEAGHTYHLSVEYSHTGPNPLRAVRLGHLLPQNKQAIEHAVALAATSDVVVLCVGLNDEWESEGFDRPDIDLVGKQVELIERVSAANLHTIVVLNTGSPIAMPWLERVPAVLEAWFPGQECGNAIADVLFGDVTPSGKLSETFPMRVEDNPAFINYPGENGRVSYGEGIFVGYRYYEKKKITPLFPFGFGLSYTTFAYNDLHFSAEEITSDEILQANITISNSGTRAGKEVVQCYVRDVHSKLMRPEKELKAFAKVSLEPGENKVVTFTLDYEAWGYFDDLEHSWVAEPGEFEVLIGSSSQDIKARATFHLSTGRHWL